MIHIDLDYGEIGFLIAADHFCIVLHTGRVVLQVHANAVRLLDHVTIGNDVSLGVNDYARSQRTFTDWALFSALSAEEFVEEIAEGAFLLTAFLILIVVTAAA